jgi:hypothetical protein
VCSATSITTVVITISGASISPSSEFTITISGFTIGSSGANVADGIIVQTSTDPYSSFGINSGPLTCPAGLSWTGQPPTCSPCSFGTYQNAADSSGCKPCDPGHAQPLTGQASCSPCAGDQFSLGAAASCVPMPPVKFCWRRCGW